MTTPRRNSALQEAAFLRAEGRFAVMAGAILMAIGFALAAGLALISLAGKLAAWLPAAIAAAPVLLGWACLSYGAWRFEQALAVRKGVRPRKLHLRLSTMRVRAAARQMLPQAAKPAARPDDQAHCKL